MTYFLLTQVSLQRDIIFGLCSYAVEGLFRLGLRENILNKQTNTNSIKHVCEMYDLSEPQTQNVTLNG